MNKTHEDLDLNYRKRRRRRALLWVLGITVALLLAIIVSQQLWLWTVLRPDTASETLLLFALSTLNFVAFVVFLFIFVRNLLKLRRERQERQLGSKVKTRLLVYFISISFLPITAMATFSYLFLNRSLEKWFYPFPEGLVQQATQAREESLANQIRTLGQTASLAVMLLNRVPSSDRQATLDQLLQSSQLSGVDIATNDGHVVARSRSSLTPSEAEKLESLFDQARRMGPSAGSELADGREFDVLAMPLNATETLFISPAKRSVNDLNELISGSERDYQELVKKQRRVRLLGLSTLGLMTLILLFVSSWVAIYLARGIATPIKALAEASNEVARGNLGHRVTTIADDELAMLANSFNQMTMQLEENRRRIDASATELRETNLALRERRNYIETVLQSLSTGVISIDEADRVTTLNTAAARMFGLPAKPESNRKLNELMAADDWTVVDRLLRRARRTRQAAEQTQLEGGGNGHGPLPVAMTATALRDGTGPGTGVVLVIEDLSELLAAQRVAAWSEVARRMAHEIKNPLTPIQLSAERIARNYGNISGNGGTNGDASDKERVGTVIAECTETITREVAGLKAMVDEFSRFARLPATRLENADLNEVIHQAVALYEDRLEGATIKLDLDPSAPSAMLDTEQIKRVFVNLIDNALAAVAKSEQKLITIATRHDSGTSSLVAEVSDSGQGIASEDFR
ncbi:MAG TPA: HAMP domain-containing protein, partial [Pyrinomonadaceae bacterium]